MLISYGMNRNHLALFHTVARAGSISGGAVVARVSQPAVSRQIAELEAQLGVNLLDRLPRGCRLTEAGRILADFAQRWRALEDEAERAIAEYRGLKHGRLAVGASQTIGAYLLPPMLAEFHRHWPDVDLHVEIGNTEQIQRALLDGTVDLGLTEGLLESPELESTVFFQDELVAVAPSGHPLLKQKVVTVRELCREPLLLREEGSGTRAVLEQALRLKGLEVRPFLSLSSPEAIKNAVAAGMGLAVVSRLIIGLELESGALAVLPLKDLKIRRPMHRQSVRGRSVSPSQQAFLEVMQTMQAMGV